MIRTDLITERRELNPNKSRKTEFTKGHVTTECVIIDDPLEASSLKIPLGKYFTVEFEEPSIDAADITASVNSCLLKLLDFKYQSILIAGLGNRAVTPDALGPLVCDRINATRHIHTTPLFAALYDNVPSISVIATGVLSSTGIDAAEQILAIAKQIKPSAVIVIDALAARRPNRLCRTIQMSNTGIIPASGCSGDRPAIDNALLGVPVISIGIPTVVDSRTYRLDCGGEPSDEELMLTPVDIDRLIIRCATIIADSINGFFGTITK